MASGLKFSPEWYEERQRRNLPKGSQLATRANPAPAKPAPKPKKARVNKYGAERTSTGDSKKESRRLQELRLLAHAGQIHDLIPQVTFALLPAQDKPGGGRERAVTYTADAIYVENGRLVIEETKSEATKKARDWPLRRKLMLDRFGIAVREV